MKGDISQRGHELLAQLRERTDPKREERRLAGLERIADAHRRLFERECREGGLNPNGLVSPVLVRKLGGDYNSSQPNQLTS